MTMLLVSALRHYGWLVLSLVGAGVLQATPEEAETMANVMVDAHQKSGFTATSFRYTAVLSGGGLEKDGLNYLVPVLNGVEYVLLVGTDQGALINNVYDETGGAILDGRPAFKPGGIQFRGSYDGTARVNVFLARSAGEVNFHVLLMSRRLGGAAAPKAATVGWQKQEPVAPREVRQKLRTLPQMPERNEATPLPSKMEEQFQTQLADQTKRGYSFTTGCQSYACERKSYLKLLVPVTKGMSYVVVAASNSSVGPIRGYVSDEAGTFLAQDTYTNRQFNIPFFANYNGTAVVNIEVSDVDTIGQVNVAVGAKVPRTK